MRQELTRNNRDEKLAGLYHYKDGQRLAGPNPDMVGDCSGLRGDCTGLVGVCTGLVGDCSRLVGVCTGLIGDCSGLDGVCSGLVGDLDACEITDEDRRHGVAIEDLVKPTA
jgi:hypothetical protein